MRKPRDAELRAVGRRCAIARAQRRLRLGAGAAERAAAVGHDVRGVERRRAAQRRHPADAIHHPGGDLKKFSQGNVRGYHTFSDGSSFVEMGWTRGVTENGSSGSGLFTQNPAASYFEVRGTLSGGESACTNQQGTDYYTPARRRLSAGRAIPRAGGGEPEPDHGRRRVLQRGARTAISSPSTRRRSPAATTASPAGWVRTGYRFLAYSDPAVAPAGAQPVCRLYAPPPRRHPLLLGVAAGVRVDARPAGAAFRVRERGRVLHPGSRRRGDVPGQHPGRLPLRRATRQPSRWRYTAEVDLRDAIISDGGWTQEGTGSGANRAVMCTPLTGAAVPVPVDGQLSGTVVERRRNRAGASISRIRATRFSPRGLPTTSTARRCGWSPLR